MTETDPHSVPPVPEPIMPASSASSDAHEIQEVVPPPGRAEIPADQPVLQSNCDDPPARWYMGIIEATLWWCGTLTVHVIGGVIMAILLIVANYQAQKPRPFDITDATSMTFLTAGEMTLFVLAAIVAVSIRYWGRTLRELNFSQPDVRHVLIVLGLTLPLSTCVSLLGVPVRMAWEAIGEAWPALKTIDGMNMMSAVEDMAESTSLPTLVFMIAVLPAIGEELIFRGAIGRILIANLGIWGGVLLTSIMFGWMHIHPVHAMSVIPLGIAIHLVYLWTRSFWMPILLHFANNGWASVVVHFNWADSIGETPEPGLYDILQLICGGIAVGALLTCLWQSRIRFFTPSGEEYVSARFPVRLPPITGIEAKGASIQPVVWSIAVVSTLLFNLCVFWSVTS